jgi:hypothetical protein
MISLAVSPPLNSYDRRIANPWRNWMSFSHPSNIGHSVASSDMVNAGQRWSTAPEGEADDLNDLTQISPCGTRI